MYNHWEGFFPNYYCFGVQNLIEEEIMDPKKFFWKNKQDIIYEGLNLKFAKAFVAAKTKKPSRKTSSFEHARKYFDAVQ